MINGCDTCQRRKIPRNQKRTRLYTIEADNKFEQLQIDLYSGIPPTQGYNAIMVVTDIVTKYVVLSPLKDKTATSVAKAFWKDFVKYFGFPIKVQTDCSKEFTFEFALEFFRTASDKYVKETEEEEIDPKDILHQKTLDHL